MDSNRKSKLKIENVLLVDTNLSSLPIYEYLDSRGYKVFVIGGNTNDTLAKSVKNFIQGDYSKEEILIEAIKVNAINRLIPGCNDVSYRACSLVNEMLGNPFKGIESINATDTLNNKELFRQHALKLGLSIPKYFQSATDIDKWPIIIKPVDAFSGKGITVLGESESELIDLAVEKAKTYSKTRKIIIEEYVKGQLYSHSAFIKGQKVIHDFIVEEHCTVNPFVVDTSRVTIDFSPILLAKIRSEINKLCNSLNLVDGLIHTQIITNGKEFWIIEITKRCPGDLYSQLIELTTGFPYSKAYSLPFLGHSLQNINPPELNTPIIRHTITTGVEEIFYYLSFQEKLEIKRFYPLSISGDNLKPSPLSRVGILFLNDIENKGHNLFQTLIKRNLY